MNSNPSFNIIYMILCCPATRTSSVQPSSLCVHSYFVPVISKMRKLKSIGFQRCLHRHASCIRQSLLCDSKIFLPFPSESFSNILKYPTTVLDHASIILWKQMKWNWVVHNNKWINKNQLRILQTSLVFTERKEKAETSLYVEWPFKGSEPWFI